MIQQRGTTASFLVPSLVAIAALSACGQDAGAGSMDEAALTATPPTAVSTTAPRASNLVGSGGIVAVPTASSGGSGTATPGVSASSTLGAPANSSASTAGTPSQTASAPATTAAQTSEPAATQSSGAGGALSTAPASSSSSVAGTGGSSAAAGGSGPDDGEISGDDEPAIDAGGGETEPTEPEAPLTFQKADGTIPNSPQPESVVDLDQGSWQEGLISPTMDEGTQVNQPVVLNGYLLISGNEEFRFYDVSNPAAPSELSHVTSPDRRTGEAESHSLSFARYADTFYMVTIGGTGIDTWDVTDPTAPEHLARLNIDGTNYGDYTEAIWGVSWQGQYIYVGATNNGIKVVDATDPAAPEVVAEVPTSQFGGVSAGTVDAIGNVLVVSTPKESGGVATLDITNPTEPVRLASFSASTSYIGQFYRRWVFLISPLRAWDVLTDPRNIGTGSSPLDSLNHEGSEYMSFSDDYLFLGHVRTEISGVPGASKIDVSNPANMQIEGRVWGRLDRNGKNDDQFSIPLGNLLVLGDDQAPYAGWVIAAHQTDPDTVPPEVDTVIPKDQETGVSTQARIGISFSDNIELATVNVASFVVRPVGGEPLPGKFGARMGVLNFDPDEDLQPGTTYEVLLRAGGIADLVGNTLASEWKSTFTTL